MLHARAHSDNTTRHVHHARTEEPSSTVRRLFESADRDVDAAVAALVEEASRRSALADWLIQKGAKSAVNELIRNDTGDALGRRASYQPNVAADRAQQERAAGLGRIARNALYNILLSSNGRRVRLGDATKADLEYFAERREIQARTMTRDAIWYRAIAGRLSGAETVSQKISESALRKLQLAAYESDG